ncbi:MAG: hypothetical protein VX309_03590 [Pseudomonadota bacterium]|nr:hypothetical protein [Pseudomonadota bacterium]
MGRFVAPTPEAQALPVTKRMQRFGVTQLIIGSTSCQVTINRSFTKRIWRPYAIWLAGGPLAENDNESSRT